MNKFVYIKNDYENNGFSIKKNEIGILNNLVNNIAKVNFVNQNKDILIDKSLIEEFNPSQTGDQYEKKVCNICNRLLETFNFQKNQNGKNNRSVRRPSCNDCRKIIDGADMPSHLKREWNKIKPHMIIWECPICKKRTIPGLTSKVVLDHDHITGKPRAWICDSCNTGLGRFKDDITTIQDAIEYLKKKKSE